MELNILPPTVMPPPAVTLNFDILTPKSKQHVYERKHVCDHNRVKFRSLVFEIQCSQGFRWDTQTHWCMDTPEYRTPTAPKVFDGKGIKHVISSLLAPGIKFTCEKWTAAACHEMYVAEWNIGFSFTVKYTSDCIANTNRRRYIT